MSKTNFSRRDFEKLVSVAGLAFTGLLVNSANPKLTFEIPGKENLRFLFQGDSITDGNHGPQMD